MNAVAGLDISSKFIRVAILECSADKMDITSFYSIATPAGSIRDGTIIKPKQIAALLKDSFSKRGIRPDRASFTVSSPYALMRLIRLPHMLEKEYRFAIEKEVSQYTIFQDKDMVIDLSSVEEIMEEGVRKSNVLFAVVPKEISLSYSSLANLLGCELVNIDVTALAIIRVLTQTNLNISFSDTAMLAILDVESLDIVVMKGSKPRFVHTAKIDLAEFQSNPDEFVAKLISAVKLALSFYQEKFAGGESVSKVVLCALNPEYRDIGVTLAGSLSDMAVETAGDIGKIFKLRKGLTKDELAGLNSEFLPAIGSAVSEAKNMCMPAELSLISAEYFKKIAMARQFVFGGILLGFITLMLLMGNSVLYLKIKSVISRADGMQKQLEKAPLPNEKIINLREGMRISENALLEKSAFITGVEITPWHIIIAETLSRLSNGLRVISMSTDRPEEMTVIGEAYSEDAIYKYIKNLRALNYFVKVELRSSQSAKEDDKELLRFNITCTVKEQAKE